MVLKMAWSILLLLGRTKYTKKLWKQQIQSRGKKDTSVDGYNMKAGYYINSQSRKYHGENNRSFQSQYRFFVKH